MRGCCYEDVADFETFGIEGTEEVVPERFVEFLFSVSV